jgi:hypothetical protein
MRHREAVAARVIAILAAALYCQQTCLGQTGPWERLQLIESGKAVHVKLRSGRTVKGKIESWTSDGLSLRQGKDKVVSLERSDVRQVAMQAGMSRARRATWAGLIGGAAGDGLGGAICAGDKGCDANPGVMAAGTAL